MGLLDGLMGGGLGADEEGGDIDADIIAQLMGQASEGAGPDPTMAFAGPIMKSPFYNGVASHSGAGQISEAILPIVLGLMAGKQAEKQQAAASAMAQLKTMLTLEQLAVQKEKAVGAREDRALKKHKVAQEAAAFESFMGIQDPNLPIVEMTAEMGGVKMKRRDPSMQKQGIGDAIKEAMTPFGKAMATQAYGNIISNFEKDKLYPDPETGQRRPYPSGAVVEDAQRQIISYSTAKPSINRGLEIARTNPRAFGITAEFDKVIAGARAQGKALTMGSLARNPAQKKAAESFGAMAGDIRKGVRADIASSRTDFDYERYFPKEAYELDTIKNGLAYNIARINDDNGKVSNQDFEAALTQLEGRGWFGDMFSSAASFASALSTVDNMMKDRVRGAATIMAERARASNAASIMMGQEPMSANIDFSGALDSSAIAEPEMPVETAPPSKVGRFTVEVE